jgi:hypothetical protein
MILGGNVRLGEMQSVNLMNYGADYLSRMW